MNIWERLDRDHIVIHASGADIMQSHGDLPRRHNQFAVYDHEVRRHLAVVEEVIFPLLREDPETAAIVRDLEAEHKQLRKELGRLDRKDKTGVWMEDFNAFAARFEETCRQHDGLENLSRTTIDDARAEELGDAYEQAKIRRLNRPDRDWTRIGLGLGAIVGVAAVGAAVAARGVRRGHGKADAEGLLRLETDENLRLISSRKVEGTAVVSRAGEKLGRIESFMVDKYSGRVAYAVLSFGGHMGFGRSLFPLPWRLLDYEESFGGYALDLSKDELANAPRFKASEEPEFDAEYRRQILVFYQPAKVAAAPAAAPAEPRPVPETV